MKLQGALGWNDPQMGAALGVKKQTISAYRNQGRGPKPATVETLFESLAKKPDLDVDAIRAWFQAGIDTEPPLSGHENNVDKSPLVKDNGLNEVDSGPEKDLLNVARRFGGQRTTPVIVSAGKGSHIWSAKGAQRVPMQVKSWVTEEERTLIQIEGDSLGVKLRRVVLGFKPDDFPHIDVFLLCQSAENEDLRTIRYIEPSGPHDLLVSPDPSEKPEPIGKWLILGYADLEIRPRPSGEPEVHVLPQGISPSDKR